MIFEKGRFFEEQINQRIYEDEQQHLTCYINARDSLTFQGMVILADYYNEKYFSKSENKIVLTKSVSELKDKIKALCQSSDKITGLTVPSNEITLDAHPIVYIFEKKGNNLNPYVAESGGQAVREAINLKAFCAENNIRLYLKVYSRQADNGSCHSEALVYLKNALQQTSIEDSVKHLSPDEAIQYMTQDKSFASEYYGVNEKIIEHQLNVFLESPDMLKTAQTSACLIKNGIDTSAPLQSTKLKLSYQDKLEPFKREVPYTKGEVAHCSHPQTKSFLERDYLRFKTQRHVEVVKKIVEASEEHDLREMESRACSLK